MIEMKYILSFIIFLLTVGLMNLYVPYKASVHIITAATIIFITFIIHFLNND
jgi:hypothetical protein